MPVINLSVLCLCFRFLKDAADITFFGFQIFSFSPSLGYACRMGGDLL